MKSKTTTLLLLTIFILGLSAASFALPVELIENGDFERGTFSGWDYHGNAVIQGNTVQGNTVHKGQWAAGLSVSQLQDSCWLIGNDTNPCSAFLAQELNGFTSTDQKLTVSFAYNVNVLYNFSSSNDHLYAGLVGWNGNIIYAQEILATDYTTDWVTISHEYDLSGLNLDRVFLAFFFADSPGWFGSCDVSSAFIDDVSVKANPVPEPATILLLGLGLVSLSLFGRKRTS